jgi:flagellin FlaB
MKNNMNNTNNEKQDTMAAIGIGAMIVFIALILVAAVAAAVIIQTAEKLQQNAQSTGDDTTDEMSGKIQVLNVFVNDDDGYVVYFRLAAGSDDVGNSGILWQLSCDDNAGGLSYLADDFAANAITPLDGTAAVTVAEAGVAYRTTLVADADPADNTDPDCGPDHLFSNNLRATLYLHVVGGGTTYDVLKVNDDTIGAVVV